MKIISSLTNSFFGVVQVKKVKKKRKRSKSEKPRLYLEKAGLFFRWFNENEKWKASEKLQKARKNVGKYLVQCINVQNVQSSARFRWATKIEDKGTIIV